MALTGKHLIAGNWVGAAQHLKAHLRMVPPTGFSRSTIEKADQASQIAKNALISYGCSTRTAPVVLNTTADEIETRGIQVGALETVLPDPRSDNGTASD